MIKYTPDHEWLDDSDGEIAIGITEHAASELGEIVYIELPEIGQQITAGDEVVVIESVKAASEIGSPLDGVISAVNTDVADNPGLVNEDAMSAWFFRVAPKDPDVIDSFMDEDAYTEHIS